MEERSSLRKRLTRRSFLKFAAASAGLAILGLGVQCGPTPTPQVIKETVVVTKEVPKEVVKEVTKEITKIVEKPVEKVVKETVVVEKPVVKVVAAGPKPLPPDAAPPDKQVFRIMTLEDRYICSGIGGYNVMWNVASSMFENLVQYNNDWMWEPGQVDSCDISPDGLVYTYRFRPGLTWSDGTPLTAHDYVTHFKTQLDPKNATTVGWYWYPLKNAQEVNLGKKPVDELAIRAIDDLTLEMTLKEPTPYWNHLMAYQDSHAYPAHMWKKYGDTYMTGMETSATSAFWKITEWTKGKRIVCEPRDNYTGRFPGYLRRVEFIFGQPTAQFAAYQAGEIDIVPGIVSPGDIAAIIKDPQLSKEHNTWPQWNNRYVLFDCQKPPYNDVRCRKAISHACDRDAITKGPLKDMAVSAYALIPLGFPGSQEDKEEIRQIQKYDPDLARKYLAEAGYPNGKGFPKLDLWLRGTADAIPEIKAAAEALQAMWKDILNIEVSIRPEDAKVYMDAMGKYQIPISLITWNFDYPDPYNMTGQQFRSKFPATGGRQNWVNKEFDKLTDEGLPVADLDKRYKMFQETERILLEDVGCVILYHPIVHELWKPWVKGVEPNKAGVKQFSLVKNIMPKIYIAKH